MQCQTLVLFAKILLFTGKNCVLYLDSATQTSYNKEACKIQGIYARKYKLKKATTDNITGGEKDAYI